MTVIKGAEKLCTIVNSEKEFRRSVREGRTLAFVLQDNVDCCTSFIGNLVDDPDLKEILSLFEIDAVYLDNKNEGLFSIFRKEDVYCVPFVIAYDQGERVGYLSSNIPAHKFYDELEQWYEL